MIKFAIYILDRLHYSLLGVFHALKDDLAFQIQFIGGGIFVGGVIFVFHPLSQLELLALLLAWGLVLITELQNTATETTLDRLHPKQHAMIGKSKDMASGAVLIAGFFAFAVVLVIVYNHFSNLA